jgi:hypothetical protein
MLTHAVSIGLMLISPGQVAPTRQPEFVLCNADPHNDFAIKVKFNELLGVYEDYGTNIEACGHPNSGCIAFPLVISAPPALPSGYGDMVSWTVDGFQFQVIGSTDPTIYTITASGHRADGAPIGRLEYTYHVTGGIIAFRSDLSSDRWVRCSGRLTFSDLVDLRSRLEP